MKNNRNFNPSPRTVTTGTQIVTMFNYYVSVIILCQCSKCCFSCSMGTCFRRRNFLEQRHLLKSKKCYSVEIADKLLELKEGTKSNHYPNVQLYKCSCQEMDAKAIDSYCLCAGTSITTTCMFKSVYCFLLTIICFPSKPSVPRSEITNGRRRSSSYVTSGKQRRQKTPPPSAIPIEQRFPKVSCKLPLRAGLSTGA